ncbi:MAG: hypothetical protein R3B51_12695 [Thermodesulfobacteriota bacterium]
MKFPNAYVRKGNDEKHPVGIPETGGVGMVFREGSEVLMSPRDLLGFPSSPSSRDIWHPHRA